MVLIMSEYSFNPSIWVVCDKDIDLEAQVDIVQQEVKSLNGSMDSLLNNKIELWKQTCGLNKN